MTRTPTGRAKRELENLEPVAGNGLLDRRGWLRGGAALAGVMTGYTLLPPASAQQLADDAWSLVPGTAVPDYGTRSRFEKNVVRTLSNPQGEPRTQHARTHTICSTACSHRTACISSFRMPAILTSILTSTAW
jgi:hypothetical protein